MGRRVSGGRREHLLAREWNGEAHADGGGAAPTTVASIFQAQPPSSYQPSCAFVVDSTYLYYCDQSGANVLRQPLAGGPTFSIAQLPGAVTNGSLGPLRLANGKLYAQVNDKDGKSPGFLITTLPP
jgi:hypothetical protein